MTAFRRVIAALLLVTPPPGVAHPSASRTAVSAFPQQALALPSTFVPDSPPEVYRLISSKGLRHGVSVSLPSALEMMRDERPDGWRPILLSAFWNCFFASTEIRQPYIAAYLYALAAQVFREAGMRADEAHSDAIHTVRTTLKITRTMAVDLVDFALPDSNSLEDLLPAFAGLHWEIMSLRWDVLRDEIEAKLETDGKHLFDLHLGPLSGADRGRPIPAEVPALLRSAQSAADLVAIQKPEWKWLFHLLSILIAPNWTIFSAAARLLRAMDDDDTTLRLALNWLFARSEAPRVKFHSTEMNDLYQELAQTAKLLDNLTVYARRNDAKEPSGPNVNGLVEHLERLAQWFVDHPNIQRPPISVLQVHQRVLLYVFLPDFDFSVVFEGGSAPAPYTQQIRSTA